MDVNLTSESRVKLDPEIKIPFTYEIVWKPSEVKFEDRFDKYLDPNFFQHRVSFFFKLKYRFEKYQMNDNILLYNFLSIL